MAESSFPRGSPSQSMSRLWAEGNICQAMLDSSLIAIGVLHACTSNTSGVSNFIRYLDLFEFRSDFTRRHRL